MGYLGIRLGVHGRGGEAGIASVGEGGGGEVVKEREVVGRATDGEMARRRKYSVDGAGESASWSSSYAQGFTLGVWRRHLLSRSGAGKGPR